MDRKYILSNVETWNRPPPRDATIASTVTVVVVTHNSAGHMVPLGGVLKSGCVLAARMLVIDNASIDGTGAEAEAAGFEVIRTTINNGFGAGCNIGLHAAATEFVIFCNPDARPAPHALERLVDALRARPMAAIAGPASSFPVEARGFARIGGDMWGFLPPWLQRRASRFASRVPVDRSQNNVAVDYVNGALIACRAEALRQAGGFDERFFLYSEEEDLCRRLAAHGWETLLVPAATIDHKASTSSTSVDEAVMAPFRFHSLYWYYRKYHPRPYAEMARAVHAACVTFDRIYRLLTRQRQVYGPGTALAPFRNIASVRRRHEQRPTKRPVQIRNQQ
jgi:N-acetylglucosaminyl-diphospho-decaprenol L-rhamnosyltransferase